MARHWISRHGLAAAGGSAIAVGLYVLSSVLSPAQQGTGATLLTSTGVPITVTRASGKSCTLADGGLNWIAPNTPCVDSVGILIEGSATNYFLDSGTPATQDMTVAGFTTYFASIQGSGNVVFTAGTANPASNIPCTATAAGPCRFAINAGGTITATVNGTVTRVQVEDKSLASFATSYIPTGQTPVTRAADIVTVPGPPAHTGTICLGVTVAATEYANSASLGSTLVSLGNPYADDVYAAFFGAGSHLAAFYAQNGSASYSSPNLNITPPKRMVGCFGGKVATTYLDGSVVDTSADPTYEFGYPPTTLFIGASNADGDDQFYGWLTDICVGTSIAQCAP